MVGTRAGGRPITRRSGGIERTLYDVGADPITRCASVHDCSPTDGAAPGISRGDRRAERSSSRYSIRRPAAGWRRRCGNKLKRFRAADAVDDEHRVRWPGASRRWRPQRWMTRRCWRNRRLGDRGRAWVVDQHRGEVGQLIAQTVAHGIRRDLARSSSW